jgi:2'-hydroxyisoflavone reductase
VVAPGGPARPMQLVDVRDLGAWMLHCGRTGVVGAFAASAPPASTTFGELLDACRTATGSDAELHWIDDATLLAHGVEPWSELPLWFPPEEGGHWWDVDTAAAREHGLGIRPLADTVADTWAWLRAEGMPERPSRPPTVQAPPQLLLSAEKEARILAAVRPG